MPLTSYAATGGDHLPEIMHTYLPPGQFASDELRREIAPAASELKAETSAGRLPVECLARMAARPVQKHIDASTSKSRAGLDRRRLVRVLDYIEANLEGDLTLDRMASIACLSRCHFARAFKRAVGHSPHRYVSARRLEHAKGLLIEGERSLVDIALALGFSSQANFSRAFKQTTGLAPGQYRQQFRPRQLVSLLADIRRVRPTLVDYRCQRSDQSRERAYDNDRMV
jgi:AraC family transcriptional regulator